LLKAIKADQEDDESVDGTLREPEPEGFGAETFML
jgi:hypothetical protein